MTCEAVECAVSLGAEDIGVNAEDASRSDLDFLIRYAKEAKNAAQDVSDIVTLSDMKTRRQLMKEFIKLPKKQKCR